MPIVIDDVQTEQLAEQLAEQRHTTVLEVVRMSLRALAASPLESLRGSVLRYDRPLQPVAEEDWD